MLATPCMLAWTGPIWGAILLVDDPERLGFKGEPAAVTPNVTLTPALPPGTMIIEGDIIVPTDFFETLQNRGTYAPNLWPGGVVPYVFNANVSPANQTAMLSAMADWEAVAAVNFVLRAGHPNFIHIQNSTGNNSYVGMQGGSQVVNIFNWNYEFIMAHELGHALGLWHEQSRTDRDAYIQINTANICQTCCNGGPCNFAFNVVPTSAENGPYDFDSVMHYGQCAFSTCAACPSASCGVDNGRTITVLPPNAATWQGAIGQRTHLSDGDKDTMAFLYPPSSSPTTGACCVFAPCGCVADQSIFACAAAGGVYQGNGSMCVNDICGCLMRACCNPAGTCIGDQTRATCEAAGNTWHIEASCTGAESLPSPRCNVYNINNCSWDNGLPLNDGGAARAHTHAGGDGQLPRYDFLAADDFILRGPDSTPCNISMVKWYFRARPSDAEPPVFPPPFPPADFVGLNVAVMRNFIGPHGLDSPGGHGSIPYDADDLNPKVKDMPGGIVYARTFLNADGDIAYADLNIPIGTYCDPPPAGGFETEHVWVADITIDPPILLNKNQKYWLAVQGMFPFDDGMSDTLQTWWMNSRNNTESRGMTYRTNYGGYVFGGLPAWEPVNFDLNPFGSECAPVQRGNAGNPAPCAGVPANTRLDFAFALTGSKDPPGPPNNACVGVFAAPPNGFDGYYTYDSAGATTDGTDAGCTVNRDVWFHYVTTSSGVLTFETCDSGYDSAIAVYDYLLFAACPPPVASRVGCDGIACGDDGRVTRVVGPFEEFLIRVGGNGTAEGRGILHIGEGVVCGNPDGGDCFQPHGGSAAGLGCNDRACCEAVCMFDPVCCESLAIGWDAECVAIASEIGACSPGAPAGIYPGNADADGQIDLLSGSTSACCPPVGCGGCQLHGDIAPLPAARCLIDVDDLLCALDGFSGTGPAACQAASDIAGCGPNGVVDVDDILTVLAAFSGIFDCPAPCPPGACIGNFPGGPVGTKCRDGDPLGAFFVENGMSESDCCALGGTYCGDCTFCGGSCTGSSICPSPP